MIAGHSADGQLSRTTARALVQRDSGQPVGHRGQPVLMNVLDLADGQPVSQGRPRPRGPPPPSPGGQREGCPLFRCGCRPGVVGSPLYGRVPQPPGRQEPERCSEHSDAATRLPAQDLERARAFYAEQLGLEPVEERPGGLLYRCGNAVFAVFQSAGAASGTHTQMGWEVERHRGTVAALRARGVVFEEYDLPGLRTMDGIAEIEGNYPSKGAGRTGRLVPDSEGNLAGHRRAGALKPIEARVTGTRKRVETLFHA